MKSNHIYASKDVFNLIYSTAYKGVFPVPFKPSIETDRFSVITLDDIPVGHLMGIFQGYKPSKAIEMHIKRCGDESLAILTIYAMMSSALVVVAEARNTTSHMYTLNPQIAATICENNVSDIDIRENAHDVEKNTIVCYEVIPEMHNNKWVFKAERAAYRMKTKQLVTFGTNVVVWREAALKRLQQSNVTIKYFDIKSKLEKRVTTSLYENTLLTMMNRSTYARILNGVVDERRAMSMFLPDLGNGEKEELTEIFLPSITDVKPCGKIYRNSFDPFKNNPQA